MQLIGQYYYVQLQLREQHAIINNWITIKTVTVRTAALYTVHIRLHLFTLIYRLWERIMCQYSKTINPTIPFPRNYQRSNSNKYIHIYIFTSSLECFAKWEAPNCWWHIGVISSLRSKQTTLAALINPSSEWSNQSRSYTSQPNCRLAKNTKISLNSNSNANHFLILANF